MRHNYILKLTLATMDPHTTNIATLSSESCIHKINTHVYVHNENGMFTLHYVQ